MEKKPISLAWSKFLEYGHNTTIIGNDILALSCDDIILFHNLHNGEHNYYRACSIENGDGITCLAGHKTYYIFSFAEKCFKPRIILMKYPEFEKIQVLPGDASGDYLDICFSEGEILTAITGYPEYRLKIWNFRLGQLLCTIETNFKSQLQILISSSFEPLTIAQKDLNSELIQLWELHGISDEILVIHRSINTTIFGKKFNIPFTFGQDSWIYFVDMNGNLYGMNTNGVTPKILYEKNNEELNNINLVYYRNGCVIGDGNCNVRFVKKINVTDWSEIWTVSLQSPICNMYWITSIDKLYALDNAGMALELDDSTESIEFKILCEEGYHVKYFDILSPDGKYVVVFNQRGEEIVLLDIKNGQKISKYTLNNHDKNITCMCSHPQYPIIIYGNKNGILYLISYIDPKNPVFCTKFILGISEIYNIEFTNSGLYLISMDHNYEFFIIYGKIGNNMNIISHYSCNYNVLNYCVYENKNSKIDNGNLSEIKIFILINYENNNNKNNFISSRNILILTLFKSNFIITTQIIQLENYYTNIVRIPNYDHDRNYKENDIIKIGGSLYNDKIVHIIEIDDNSTTRIIEILKTIHQTKNIMLSVSESRYLLTWGIDGILCIFDLKNFNLEMMYSAGNRRNGNIKAVRCDYNRKYCLSLHNSGCLKCICIEPNLEVLASSRSKLNDLDIIPENTVGFVPKDDDKGKTWLEIKSQQEYHNEVEKYKLEKNQIYEDFIKLKIQMKQLIDNNENAKNEYKISIQNFNLSPEQTESVLEIARRECNTEKRYLLSFIDDINRITKWIINNTWNLIDIKCKNLHGIFSNILCDNYGLINWNLNDKINLQTAILLRSIELFIENDDTILLQSFSRDTTLQSFSLKESNILETITFLNNNNNNESYDNNDNDVENDKIDNLYNKINLYSNNDTKYNRKSYVFSGTSTHNFIEPSKYRYKQYEMGMFQQIFIEQILCKNDTTNLREWFNKKFEEIKKLKDDQVEQIKVKNERLRYIHNELNILAKLLGKDETEYEEILDPEFYLDEEPINIVKVEDNEIDIERYISPSMQEILDKKAYDEEQRILALMSDDFRERALITMMDGVLEKRWEDEIKKEPIIPDCIKNVKNPDEYTKDELKTIQEYNEKIKLIQIQRERYEKFLKEEKQKIKIIRNEQIMKFNQYCSDLFKLKLRIDSAIKQEEIKLLRNHIFNEKKFQILDKQKQLTLKAQNIKDNCEKLQKIIEDLEKKKQDLQNRHEQFQIRDKMLDKQIRIKLNEFTGSNIDIIYKIFKRRPKWLSRAWETNAILQDLSKRIITRNSSKSGIPLPIEIYEYLNALNGIDNYSHAPNTMDQIQWKIICNERRQKIESEFKLKACGAQLAEAESTLDSFMKELQTKKTSLIAIGRELNEFKKQYQEHVQNKTLQIVLPLGNVEINLTGHLSDFEGTSLINLSDVEDINVKIKKAGSIKLRAMNRLAIFHRKIVYQQWEYDLLKITLNNIKEKLKTIENIKVSIEMKTNLREMNQQQKSKDLSTISIESELNRRKNTFQKQLEDMDEKIKQVQDKIKAQKQENTIFDNRIQRINVQVHEQSLLRDYNLENQENIERKEKMKMILERASLVRKIQSQHAIILELTTMLELQRLRTYPTLISAKIKSSR